MWKWEVGSWNAEVGIKKHDAEGIAHCVEDRCRETGTVFGRKKTEGRRQGIEGERLGRCEGEEEIRLPIN